MARYRAILTNCKKINNKRPINFTVKGKNYDSIAIAVPSGEGKTSFVKKFSNNDFRYIDHDSLIDSNGLRKQFNILINEARKSKNYQKVNHLIRNVKVPKGSIVLTWNKSTVPNDSHYVTGMLLKKGTGIRENTNNRIAICSSEQPKVFKTIDERNQNIISFTNDMINIHPKIIKFNDHQKRLNAYRNNKISSKEFNESIKNDIFKNSNCTRELKNNNEYVLISDNDKITFKDNNNSLIHGSMLNPACNEFKFKSIASDHGCGATVFNLKDISEDEIKKKIRKNCKYLPTGGNEWSEQIIASNSRVFSKRYFPDNQVFNEYNFNFKRENSKLGSLGSGNHFVHLVGNGSDYKLVVHSGSRGLPLRHIPTISSDPNFSTFNKNWKQFLQGCEWFAEDNRETIGNFVLTGKLGIKPDNVSKLSHYTHTKVHYDNGYPLITKNITKTNPNELNLVLGSPSSGVSFITPPEDPYFIHGTGPDFGHKGKFKDTSFGKHYHSIYSFDRHDSKGGHALPLD